MSILEDIVSTSSDTSPHQTPHVQPRSRLRKSASIHPPSPSETKKGKFASKERKQIALHERYEFRDRATLLSMSRASKTDAASALTCARSSKRRDNHSDRNVAFSSYDLRKSRCSPDLSEIVPIPRHNRATRYALRCRSIFQVEEKDVENYKNRTEIVMDSQEETSGAESFLEAVVKEENEQQNQDGSENDPGTAPKHCKETENGIAAEKVKEDDRRYLLRNRAKMQSVGPESSHKLDSITRDAYADYMKRQKKGSMHLVARRQRELLALSARSFQSRNRKRRQWKRRKLERKLQHSDHKKKDALSSDAESVVSKTEYASLPPLLSSSSSSEDCNASFSSSDDKESRDNLARRHNYHKSRGSKKHNVGSKQEKRIVIHPVSVDPRVNWESIGGLRAHIDALKEMVLLPLMYPEIYEKYHIMPPSGVLFYGPPGTGKTLLARALATSCSLSLSKGSPSERSNKPPVTFYMRRGADCLSKWVGEAERNLRVLFEEAKRNEPSIIFFDELDGLAPVRSSRQDQIHTSVVSTLLALMDGLSDRGKVVVIGATNRLDAIDPALRRPGRFDRELAFHLPKLADREQILSINVKKWPSRPCSSLLKRLAKSTVGYCGADLRALCSEAVLCSLRRSFPQVYSSNEKLLLDMDRVDVLYEDFTRAIEKIRPASWCCESNHAKPLAPDVFYLLRNTVEGILHTLLVKFPSLPINENDVNAVLILEDTDETENSDVNGAIQAQGDADGCVEVTKSCLKDAPSVKTFGIARILITGKPGMGQEHVGSSVVYALEGFTCVMIDYASLISDRDAMHAEEALVRRLRNAQKGVPSVIYLPDIHIWYKQTTSTMQSILKLELNRMQSPDLALVFIAVATESHEEMLPESLLDLFPLDSYCADIVPLSLFTKKERREHFEAAFNRFKQPPKKRSKAQLPATLPLAPAQPQHRQMEAASSKKEYKLRERDIHLLRELRIFLCQVLDYCFSEKKYAPFFSAVDPAIVPSYAAIISDPMDLTLMQEKLHDGKYHTFELFMHDIDQIVRNACLFNPKHCSTRGVAHAAGIMRDNVLSFAHRFRKQQGFDLFAKCRAIDRKQKRAGIQPPEISPEIASGKPTHEETSKMDDTMEESPGKMEDDAECDIVEETELYENGALVFVKPQTQPGMNRLGGVGVVQEQHADGSYSIKYVLGGCEKHVTSHLLQRYTDQVVQDSVITDRRKLEKNESNENCVSAQSAEEMRRAYFDELLWPILSRLGWKRCEESMNEEEDEGSHEQFQTVFSVPIHKEEIIRLLGFTLAIEYVKKNQDIATQCFGNRFKSSEKTQTCEKVESHENSIEDAPAIFQETLEHPEAMKMQEITVEETISESDSVCIFDENRMEQQLEIFVEKTANWNLKQLRNTLERLNHLFVPFHTLYDRRPLVHVSIRSPQLSSTFSNRIFIENRPISDL
uniref:ATPase family AAA domaincontaining protein 2 putati n=1 Tax=Albugo laibachii Nc14 TaxID=890382 RepID=F0WM31_9STRA|nr:ATPase family AAA domaincontaining protein 2 putati [Albugo laibachii Nc14]|eukprot:CCA22358.1 ATPase family AAA domaincontaining protein 2 putati [Albugo laibachii Nc14]